MIHNRFDSPFKSSSYSIVNSIIATSSYNNLLCRLTLGSDGIKTTYSSSGQTIFSKQPDQNTSFFTGITGTITGSLLHVGVGDVNPFEGNTEHFVLYWPDIISQRKTSDKIRIVSNSLETNALFYNIKNEESSYKQFYYDSPKIGIYFSPQHDIDFDVAQFFGSQLSIDDLVGDPRDVYEDQYEDLAIIRDLYFKQYHGRPDFYDFLHSVKSYGTSMFRVIKTILPARSTPSLGIVIEQHMLERSKLRSVPQVTYTTPNHNAEISMIDYIIPHVELVLYTGSISYNTQTVISSYISCIEGLVYSSSLTSVIGEYINTNDGVVDLKSRFQTSSIYTRYNYDNGRLNINRIDYREVLMPTIDTARVSETYSYTSLIALPSTYHNTDTTLRSLFTTGSYTYYQQMANVQDYDRNYAIARRIRYEGTKVTSPKWNAKSPDTYENEPVVSIFITNPNTITADNTSAGTFKIE